jgi:hypothetical protein
MKKLFLFFSCIFLIGIQVFSQRLLWHRTYPIVGSSIAVESLVLTKSNSIIASDRNEPFLIDSSNRRTTTPYLFYFGANGDSLAFAPQSPGIISGINACVQLTNSNIVYFGRLFRTPFQFQPFGQPYLIRLMDSTSTVVKRDYVFQDLQTTRTLGDVGGVIAADSGRYWVYGTREDSALTNNYSPYLMLFDSTGNLMWERDYLDSGNSGTRSMIRLKNNHLVMFGSWSIPKLVGAQQVLKLKYFALEVDNQGQFIRRTYFDLYNQPGQSFSMDQNYDPVIYGAAHPDGSYVLYGKLLNRNGNTDSTGFITKIDTNFTQNVWVRRMDPIFKLRVLADGSSFIAGYLNSRIRGRYMFLRRYDTNGSLFQDFRLSGVQGTLPSGPYSFYNGEYEFAGDSSVIFVGNVINQAYTNLFPYLYIAKIGGYPNPYNPLALPLDRRMMEETYVYPNPFQDQFTLATKSGATEAGQLYLFNLLGQQVYQSPYTTGELMRTPPIKPGIYLWRFVGKDVYSGRLVRE